MNFVSFFSNGSALSTLSWFQAQAAGGLLAEPALLLHNPRPAPFLNMPGIPELLATVPKASTYSHYQTDLCCGWWRYHVASEKPRPPCSDLLQLPGGGPCKCCVRDLVVVFSCPFEPSALVNDRDTPMLFSYAWLCDCSPWTVVMLREKLMCSFLLRFSRRCAALM